MFARRLLVIAVLLVVGIFANECLGASLDYDAEAKQFLNEASSQAFELYNKFANETFNSPEPDSFEEIFNQRATLIPIAEELIKLSKESRKFELAKIQNEHIKNALMEIRLVPDIFVLGKKYFTSILDTINALETISTDADIKPYLDAEAEEIAYDGDIVKIFKSSNNPEELKYYWQAWRDKNAFYVKEKLYPIVEAIQNAAKELDIDVLEFWYRFNLNKDFYKEMERIMEELKPFYLQLHAFIRNELHKKYGYIAVDPSGPIPDHLIQQVSEQVWGAGSVLEPYFPFSELPPYDEFVEDFSADEMLKEANGFFKSLGFTELDELFISNYTKAMPVDETGADCKAGLFDLTPQVYLEYCSTVDFRKFMQMHGYLEQALYAKVKRDVPFYYFNSYHLEYPLGEAFILSASTPKHLSKIKVSKDFKFDEKALKNRLFRMGLHTFFNIPKYFVLNKVMEDLLSGALKMKELNKHYWQLMEKYAGIEPPMDRDDESIDFPYKFYDNIEYNMLTEKFVTEILGYQFYQSICKKINQDKDLQNCDFYEHKEIGNDIRSMMQLGSSKPYAEVIGKLLGEKPTISGQAMLDYYAPMKDWLEAKNKEANVKVGWSASKKTVE